MFIACLPNSHAIHFLILEVHNVCEQLNVGIVQIDALNFENVALMN
jgi:hypothetical protein